MNNSTEHDAGWSSLPFYLLSATIGALISAANLLIVISIARYGALRKSKEFVLMLGLSLADALNMMAYFLSAGYRISLLVRGIHSTTTTIAECMHVVPTLFLSYGVNLSCMMVVAISADRLLCVLFPLTYLGWTDCYASRLVASVYTVKLIDTVYFYVKAYDSTAIVAAPCAILELVSFVNELYRVAFNLTLAFFPLLSVCIYLVVICIHMKRTNNRVQPADHPHQEYELKRQRRVTVTLCVGALCTLFLYVIPFSIGIAVRAQGYYTISLIFISGSHLNSLASVFLYPLRHGEIKMALRHMFTNKHMPADIKMWKYKEGQKDQVQMIGKRPMIQEGNQQVVQQHEDIEIATL